MTRLTYIPRGGGFAGVTAAQTLQSHGVKDFLILEYNNDIGGRVRHTDFGHNPSTKKPYVVELGANWIESTVLDNGDVNPIMTLAKKYSMKTAFTRPDFSVYDQDGKTEFDDELRKRIEDSDQQVRADAASLAETNGTDRSIRQGLRLAGWNLDNNPYAQASEVFNWDLASANPPDVLSMINEIGGINGEEDVSLEACHN